MKHGLCTKDDQKNAAVIANTAQKAKNACSYQVLDVQGNRSTNIKLIQKREFRLPFRTTQHVSRKLQISFLRRSGVPAFSGEYTWPLLGQVIQHLRQMENMLRHLKQSKEPTHSDAMIPLDAMLDILVGHFRLPPQKGAVERRNMLVLHSAAFFEQAEAHKNDQKLLPRAQYRALTTYWVYMMLESIFQDKNEVAWSSKAYDYSFLYPYTDDLMDMNVNEHPGIETENISQVKSQLGRNISHKIKTGQHPKCYAMRDSVEGLEQEMRIYELLDSTLSTDDSKNEVLRDSLFAINLAQIASLQQKCKINDLNMFVKTMRKKDKKKIFDITMTKGAASIMPIAYLSNSSITKEQAKFASTLGCLLQLINDIEGLHEDLAEKSLTPAVLTFVKHGCLGRYIERFCTFMHSMDQNISLKFPNLPRGRIHTYLTMIRFRFLTTVALCHIRGCELGSKEGCAKECKPRPILSPVYVKKLQKQLKMPLSMLASIAKIEQEVFGGALPSPHCCECHENKYVQCQKQQISPPERLRDFIVGKSEELLHTKL